MELYAEYVKERGGLDIIKNDVGFLTYRISKDECFLADMFIRPGARGGNAFPWFIEELCKIASGAGCSYISANIHQNDPGSTRSLKAALKLGFRFIRAEHGIVVIEKLLEVKNG